MTSTTVHPAKPLSSTHPAVLSLLLWWLGDTLPGPTMPSVGADTPGGFATPTGRSSSEAWRDCEQCHDGATKRGPCVNCGGKGGWHYDPMDDKRHSLVTSADAHPELGDRPAVRIVRTSSVMDADVEAWREWAERFGYDPVLPPVLEQLAAGLAELRQQDRYQRAILQRVYLIRLDRLEGLRECDRRLHDRALEHLGRLLGEGFKAPRWCRERAAARTAA